MSIRPHPTKGSGWWQIWISKGRGNKPDIIVYQGTKLEAQAFESEIRGIPKHGNARLIDIVSTFLQWYENNRLKRTVEECKRILETRIIPFYGDKLLQYISNQDHENYKTKRLSETARNTDHPPTKRTINLELLALRSLMTWAKANDYDVGASPQLFPKKQTKPAVPQVLSPEELTALSGQLSGKTRLMVLLMGKCGLRRGETLKLTPSCYADGMLVVDGKGGKQRLVPLPPDVDKEFQATINKIPNNEAIFTVKDIRKRISTAATKAGITKHVHPHLFRHTAGTIAVQAGVQQRIIQEWLGHSDIRTTEIYTRVVAESLKQATAQMSQMYQTKTPRKRKAKAD